MAKVVLTEQQHSSLYDDCIINMRIYVYAAAKRAGVVKENGLLTNAEMKAHPLQVGKARYTESRIWLGSECFKMASLTDAANVMTSRYVYTWAFVKNEGDR
eukprot:2013541-Pyramimonas_sp.AAC.1